MKAITLVALLAVISSSIPAYASWDGTYTHSETVNGFLHVESDVVTGNTVVGTHTFDNGELFGSFMWTGSLSSTSEDIDWPAADLSGSGIRTNLGESNPFTITAGKLYLGDDNRYHLFWQSDETPLHPFMGWETFKVAAPVPEPESYAMLLAGLGLMGGIARRKQK